MDGVTAPVPAPGTPVQTGIAVSTADLFITVDATSQVIAWLNGSPNNGLIITGEGSTSVVLDSKENQSTSHPATLEISLIGPAGSTGATGQAGPTGTNGTTGAPRDQRDRQVQRDRQAPQVRQVCQVGDRSPGSHWRNRRCGSGG